MKFAALVGAWYKNCLFVWGECTLAWVPATTASWYVISYILFTPCLPDTLTPVLQVSVLVLLLLPSIMLGAKRKGPKAWDQNLVRVARSYVEPAEVGKRSGGHAKWDENMIRVARSGGFPLNLAYLFESLSNRGAFEVNIDTHESSGPH